MNKRCYVSCNLNAWSTENIMMKWINKIWFPYIYDEDKLNEEGAFFLILGKATSHYNDNLIKRLTTPYSDVAFIPGGMTRFFQSLDFSVNKPYKEALKNKYVSYCIDNGVDNLKLSRNITREFVCDVWYNNDIVSK